MEIVADPVPMAVDEHGMVRIAGTQIILDSVIWAYNRGDRPEEIHDDFPDISLADIHAVIAYYLRNTATVDTYLAGNELAIDVARREFEAQFGKQPKRAELEARLAERLASKGL